MKIFINNKFYKLQKYLIQKNLFSFFIIKNTDFKIIKFQKVKFKNFFST